MNQLHSTELSFIYSFHSLHLLRSNVRSSSAPFTRAFIHSFIPFTSSLAVQRSIIQRSIHQNFHLFIYSVQSIAPRSRLAHWRVPNIIHSFIYSVQALAPRCLRARATHASFHWTIATRVCWPPAFVCHSLVYCSHTRFHLFIYPTFSLAVRRSIMHQLHSPELSFIYLFYFVSCCPTFDNEPAPLTIASIYLFILFTSSLAVQRLIIQRSIHQDFHLFIYSDQSIAPRPRLAHWRTPRHRSFIYSPC